MAPGSLLPVEDSCLEDPAGGSVPVSHVSEHSLLVREPVPDPSRPPPASDRRDESIARLLDEVKGGDRGAFDRLFPLVYDELHRLAELQRRRWDDDPSLNTTGLLHEAYIRLAGQEAPEWRGPPHFLAVAATAMRQILLDQAKRRRAAKRGGGLRQVPIHEIEMALGGEGDASGVEAEALIALDEALRRLSEHDARQSRIVECRFFGGMDIQDTAAALGVSPATVKRGWAMAQAWLYREMSRGGQEAS